MTVTRDQAQMLATLAVACRPHRAPTWDPAGVVAAIGKVKERSLPEVALAVIRAAADRDAKTPGVIPTAGSHWQEQLKPEPWRPDQTPREERCGICNHGRHDGKCPKCARNDDHAFEPDIRRDTSTDIPRVVQALREDVAPAPVIATKTPDEQRAKSERRAELDRMREADRAARESEELSA